MRVLGLLIRDGAPQVAASPIDWTLLSSRFTAAPPPPLLEKLVAEALVRSAAMPADHKRGPAQRAPLDLEQLAPSLRAARLTELVRQELATVLALGSAATSIDNDSSFPSLGLDSLTAVELRNRLQQALGRPLPATAAFEWPSVGAMANGLNGLYVVADKQAAGVEDEASEREELLL